ncbi:ABC transporter ATP-binding protein [Roseibium algae]|uniref:ABC transporter ATP-binding protein n=1 Tax=Roseibium algae TaxID=3123038 RepID=A0ABU8TIB2_9HYPH
MTAASLKIREISWGPSKGLTLLHPVSFELVPGDCLGVVGANGAGKSTLLRLIYRYLKPRTGQILLDEQDLWRLSARQAAQKVAAVLQEQPTDFALTVREIVALGRRPHASGFSSPAGRDQVIVTKALADMQLQGLQNRRFGTLSGGERQRAMVARALAQEPKLLVLDEPTNHLDIRHQLEILELVRGLPVTVVTSLHDLNMAASLCDTVLVLAGGYPLAFGPPSQVITPEHVDAAFAVQSRLELLQPSGQPHLTFSLPS